jgi:hypothetical protein
VTATGTAATNFGASVRNAGNEFGFITAYGDMTVSGSAKYILVNGTGVAKTAYIPTTKQGFYTYNTGNNDFTVWVNTRYREVWNSEQLTSALATIPTTGTATIKLMASFVHENRISVNNKIITFDLNGNVLDAKGSIGAVGAALEIKNGGQVKLANPANGQLNIITATHGVYALSGSKAEVTNVNTAGTSNTASVYAVGTGTEVTVYGNVSVDTSHSTNCGVSASEGAKVTVNGNISVVSGARYISVGGSDKPKTPYPNIVGGYYEYTDGTNKVLVKVPVTLTAPVISGLSGGTATVDSGTVKYKIDKDANIWFALYAGNPGVKTAIQVREGVGAVQPLVQSAVLGGADEKTRIFSGLTAGIQYTVYLVAANSAGDSNVASFTFTTLAATTAPSITTHPANKSITAGSNTTFTVVATGNPAPAYQWQSYVIGAWWDLVDDVYSQGTKSATLTINNVTSEYNGYQYRCVVTNSAGSVTSNGATLTVTPATVAPGISGPTNMSLVAGYGATSTGVFTVTGNPAPTVTKQSGNAAITWDNANKKLNIAAGLAEGSYPVVLKASNGVGTDATITFTLTVTASAVAPTVTTATLPAGVNGTPYNQTLAASGTSPMSWSVTSGSLPAGLSLSSAGVISGTPTTTGTYNFTVTVTNSAGSSNKALAITINAPAPATPTAAQFTHNVATSVVFIGKEQPVTVTPKAGVGVVNAIKYNGSTQLPINAGTYAVTIDVAPGATFGAATNLSLGTYTITKADLSKVAVTIKDMSWTGSQRKPTAFIYNGKSFSIGTAATANATPTKYSTNKNIGKASVTITGKGTNFTGTKAISFKVVPKTTKVSKIAVGVKKMTVTWAKVSSAQKVTKYQVRYRVKGTTTWKTKSFAATASSGAITGLTKGKVYEVQVRSYKTVSKVNYYSVWSPTKVSAKIK